LSEDKPLILPGKGERKVEKKKKPDEKKPAAKPAKEEPAAKPAKEEPAAKPDVEGVIKAAKIAEDPDSFTDSTILVEGVLKPSTEAKNDYWYVLLDDSGSAVLRSNTLLKHEKCRITAKVEKTNLGQTYLEVLRCQRS
jgi:hypothetical protein